MPRRPHHPRTLGCGPPERVPRGPRGSRRRERFRRPSLDGAVATHKSSPQGPGVGTKPLAGGVGGGGQHFSSGTWLRESISLPVRPEAQLLSQVRKNSGCGFKHPCVRAHTLPPTTFTSYFLEAWTSPAGSRSLSRRLFCSLKLSVLG